MPVRVLCPRCRTPAVVSDPLAGQVVRCAECQRAFRAPARQEAEAEPVEREAVQLAPAGRRPPARRTRPDSPLPEIRRPSRAGLWIALAGAGAAAFLICTGVGLVVVWAMLVGPAGAGLLGGPGRPPAQTFKSGWDPPVDPDGDCKVVPAGDALTLEVPAADHDLGVERGRMNAPRLLRDVEGDFTAQVRVGGEFHASTLSTTPLRSPFMGAGLVLVADDRTYVRLERAAIYRGGSLTHYVNWEWRVNGGWQPFAGGAPPVAAGKPTYLRLRRNGDRLLGSFSQDGVAWDDLQPLALGLPAKVKVGVSAENTSAAPFRPYYDDFRLTASSQD